MSKTTAEITPAKTATLIDIELAWLELLQQREDAEEESPDRPTCFNCAGSGSIRNGKGDKVECTHCEATGRQKSPREIAIENADVAIAEHITREVAKVDGIVGFIYHLEATIAGAKKARDHQALRAQRAQNLLDQVKCGAKYALDVLGRKRVDGARGSLIVKGNGGLQPLVISDDSLLPDDAVRMEGWMRGDIWSMVAAALPIGDGTGWNLRRVGANDVIRAMLAESCSTCKGSGETRGGQAAPIPHAGDSAEWPISSPPEKCPTCGGSGKAAVPGAYLGARGSHLEVK